MADGRERLLFGVEPQVRGLVHRLERHFATPEQRKGTLPCGDGDALVIGVFGAWGSGKTHWLKHLETQFAAQLEAAVRGGGTVTVPVFFNAWRFEKEPHLVVPMLKTAELAVRRAAQRAPKSELAKRAWYGKRLPSEPHWLQRSAQALADAAVALGAGMSAKLSVPGIAELTLSGKEMLAEERRRSEARASARKQGEASPLAPYEAMYFDLHGHLRKLMGRSSGADAPAEPCLNLLFLIDDLDRCLPDKAIEVIEAIKLFLEVPGTAFVLALDDEVIERGIAHRYRDYAQAEHARPMPITGAEYLEKIIHLPVRVPPVPVDDARGFLRDRYIGLFVLPDEGWRGPRDPEASGDRSPTLHAALDTKLLDLLVRAVPSVPRKLIRAAELLALSFEVASARMPGFRRHLLARLVLLQLFAPEVYRLGSGKWSALYLRYLAEWRGKSIETLRQQLDPGRAPGDGSTPTSADAPNAAPGDLELRRLRWERVQRPLLEALEQALARRTGFDPREVIDEGQTPDSDELSMAAVQSHHRLVDASEKATEAGGVPRVQVSQVVAELTGSAMLVGAVDIVSVADRVAPVVDRDTGPVRDELPAGKPSDLREFVAFALSNEPRDWRNALEAERGQLEGRVLDTATFEHLLERARTRPERISILWLETFEPYLSAEQLVRLYRETRVFERLGASDAQR